MIRYTRLFTDADGTSRFEDVDVPITPEEPVPHELSVSAPMAASAVLFAAAAANGGHPEQPEARRQILVGLTGSVEVITKDETRVFGPGEALLAEDLEGPGHSSRTSEGFTALVVVL
jgi:hypothetical protein